MDQETLAIWELVNNPRYKYAVGQLAAALLIATKALDEVSRPKTVSSAFWSVARLSNSNSSLISNKAIEDIHALLGERMPHLQDLAADFYQLRQTIEAETHAKETDPLHFKRERG